MHFSVFNTKKKNTLSACYACLIQNTVLLNISKRTEYKYILKNAYIHFILLMIYFVLSVSTAFSLIEVFDRACPTHLNVWFRRHLYLYMCTDVYSGIAILAFSWRHTYSFSLHFSYSTKSELVFTSWKQFAWLVSMASPDFSRRQSNMIKCFGPNTRMA